MKKLDIFLSMLVLLAAFAIAGCIGLQAPTTPAVTATAPTPTVAPMPTLIGGSDEAFITFNYEIQTIDDYYGIKPSPGKLFYLITVEVGSDKPVQTSPDWITLQYKSNYTDPVKINYANNATPGMIKYPTKTIGMNSTDNAGGEFLFELPEQMADGYPKLIYYEDLYKQQGPYYVKSPVDGIRGLKGVGPTL